MAKKQCTEEDYYNESRRLRAETCGSGDCPAIRSHLKPQMSRGCKKIFYYNFLEK